MTPALWRRSQQIHTAAHLRPGHASMHRMRSLGRQRETLQGSLQPRGWIRACLRRMAAVRQGQGRGRVRHRRMWAVLRRGCQDFLIPGQQKGMRRLAHVLRRTQQDRSPLAPRACPQRPAELGARAGQTQGLRQAQRSQKLGAAAATTRRAWENQRARVRPLPGLLPWQTVHRPPPAQRIAVTMRLRRRALQPRLGGCCPLTWACS